MKEVTIRTATIADAPAILAIYGYYVANTAISMEYEVPTLEEFEHRVKTTLENYPYLVAEQNGRIVGYAYAGRFHPRAAFYRSAEVSIYIHKEAQKCGLGRRLYEAIEEKLKELGILNVYASIAYTDVEDAYLTNNSTQFHEHMGYQKVAQFNNCCIKFGRWYHLIWMEKFLGEHK
ncbi:MAG: N-acetyltransferase [Agathobacter sp.]|nr:N-acetyltransferase [Agathobacter sp.]